MPYKERLKRLKLTTLEDRRIRGDMIQTYEILTGKEKIDQNKFFNVIQDRRGRHPLIYTPNHSIKELGAVSTHRELYRNGMTYPQKL